VSDWEVYGMPDKQNDNKFMAMLERRGIVRKAGPEDESDEADPGAVRSRPEADLRSIFGPAAGETPKVTPAARQPIPGISNPVIPGDKPFEPEREQPKPFVAQTASEQPRPTPRREEPMPLQPPVERALFEEQVPAQAAKPAPFISSSIESIDPFREETSLAEKPVSAPAEPIAYERLPERLPEPPPAESYTDRYLDIDELYEVLALRSKKTDTIYLVEEYLETLPDSLPDESRREIVGKIIAASGFDYDLLMGDGVLRVKMLKEYAEQFAQYTDDYVSERNAELTELEQQGMRIRKLIEGRRELHKKQFYAIEAEAQRLKEILTFISG